MMTNYERQQCWNYKKRMDMAQTVQGQVALKLAERYKREERARNTILRSCNGNIGIQAEENPILKFYK